MSEYLTAGGCVSLGHHEAAIAKKSKAEVAAAVAAPDTKAQALKALARMRRSLKGWLKYRRLNDQVAAGKRKATTPSHVAAATLARDRDWQGEQKLAEDIYLLLADLHDPASLPVPDVYANPNAAVELAEIAIKGPTGTAVSGPQAQGILPLIILTIGGVGLFVATSFISNRAEVQKEKEHLQCIRDGACTDFGFWLKIASVGVIGWFAWEKIGVGDKVKKLMK